MHRKHYGGTNVAVGRADGGCALYHRAGIPVVYGAAQSCVLGTCSWAVGELLCPCSVLSKFGLLDPVNHSAVSLDYYSATVTVCKHSA